MSEFAESNRLPFAYNLLLLKNMYRAWVLGSCNLFLMTCWNYWNLKSSGIKNLLY